jgi:hypothetical protein
MPMPPNSTSYSVQIEMYDCLVFTLHGPIAYNLVFVDTQTGMSYDVQHSGVSNGNVHVYSCNGRPPYQGILSPSEYKRRDDFEPYRIYTIDYCPPMKYTIQLRGGGHVLADRDIVTEKRPEPDHVVVRNGNVQHVFAYKANTRDTFTFEYLRSFQIGLLLNASDLPPPPPYVIRLTDTDGNSFDFTMSAEKPHMVVTVNIDNRKARFERVREEGRILLYKPLRD